MKNLKAKALYALVAGLCLTGAANAANVTVGSGSRTVITTSTTWTANNVYNLVGQIYIAPGATLTIEAGTLIQSNPADQGSLAICRGAKIIANGTPTKPIIFTSTLDTLAARHDGANEWGNITIMGKALIGASHVNAGDGVTPNASQAYDEGTTNTPPFGTVTNHVNTLSPDGLNKATMEGLVAEGLGDPRVLFGGSDDNDDSGSLSYVSLRYGGKVVASGNELNGLSLGGVGRETDIHHIDVYANVDDGIEIWGGTVNLKYLSIWNVGDDSFDVDQGWRGKAQFGLIVQGYSALAAQGSGVGDNCIEIDGAERNDAQPVTTAVLFNFTVIGQPQFANIAANGGDKGIALRDEAHVQFRNCIFMNIGENLLVEEASETTAPNNTTLWRYGNNGTLTYPETWQTGFAQSWNKANVKTGGHANVGGTSDVLPYNTAFLQNLYKSQTSGNLSQISDSVLFGNVNSAAYNNATVGYDAVSALAGNANVDNVKETGGQPIVSITRAGPTAAAGNMQLVTALDPRAANNALTSVGTAPADGFFTPVQFRGAFSKDVNWAKGWTAASAYGVYGAADTATTPVASGATLITIVSFASASGVVYSVESSTDGKNWSPVTTVVGTGANIDLSTLITVDAAKAYRAIAQ